MISSSTMTSLLGSVMSSTSPAQFMVGLTLVSDDGSWTYEPMAIESFVVSQEFYEGFCDDVTLGFHISSKDYSELFNNRHGLRGVLTLTFLTSLSQISLQTKPMVRKYIVTLIDPRDPKMSMVNVNARVSPDTQVTLKLFEEQAYKVRRMSVSGGYINTDLSSVIGHLFNSYGLTNAHLTTVDNPHVFTQVVLPGAIEFHEVFGYLQSRYGVYNQGMAAYYTNGSLWVYPPFDTNPLFPTQVRLYQAAQGSYAAAPSFHKWETTDVLSIVTNGQPAVVDHSVNDSENNGTAITFLRAAPEVDGIISQSSTGVLTYNQDSVITVRRATPNLTTPDEHYTRYAHQTDNIQQLTSHLSEKQHMEITVQWSMAVPFYLQPGQLVTYYSDENGKVVKRTGQTRKAVYITTRAPGGGRLNGRVVHQCHAALTLHLCPTPQVVSN